MYLTNKSSGRTVDYNNCVSLCSLYKGKEVAKLIYISLREKLIENF